MAMSRKHYRELADAICASTVLGSPNHLDKGELVERLCGMLKADNPNFNKEQFRSACCQHSDEE